jgi:hypothetical protein
MLQYSSSNDKLDLLNVTAFSLPPMVPCSYIRSIVHVHSACCPAILFFLIFFYEAVNWCKHVHLQDLADIVPKDTLIWKLKLLKSAASYTNSRIHAVKAEVLVLSRSFFSLVLVPVPLHIPRHHFIASPLHMNLCF